MEKDRVRVVLDTNIIISALVYGGTPEKVLRLVEEESKVIAITSQVLKAELLEVLVKKFNFKEEKVKETDQYISEYFEMVNPGLSIDVLKDKEDNRVLEAASEGMCGYIITGDRELLDLETYQAPLKNSPQIKIVTADWFLRTILPA